MEFKIPTQMKEDQLRRLGLWVGVGLIVGIALGALWGNVGIGVTWGIVVGAALGLLIAMFKK